MTKDIIHSFERFFELDGHEYDRKKLIMEHGLVSPAYAEKNGIPFKKRSGVINVGIPSDVYDDVIFLHSLKARYPLPLVEGEQVLIKESVETISDNEMEELHPEWLSFSEGEVYVLGRIAPEDLVWPEQYE